MFLALAGAGVAGDLNSDGLRAVCLLLMLAFFALALVRMWRPPDVALWWALDWSAGWLAGLRVAATSLLAYRPGKPRG